MPSEDIHSRITAIMGKVPAVKKAREQGAGVSFAFRRIDDVVETIAPLMIEHGIHMVPEVLTVIREDRGKMHYTVATIRHTFYAPDGSSVVAVTIGEGFDPSDKASNKAMSAALKYALCQVFMIPTQDRSDNEMGPTPEEVAAIEAKAELSDAKRSLVADLKAEQEDDAKAPGIVIMAIAMATGINPTTVEAVNHLRDEVFSGAFDVNTGEVI